MKKAMKKGNRHLLVMAGVILVAGFFWPSPIHAAGAEADSSVKSLISVESYVDRATITIGDRILYTLKIVTDPGIQLEPPSLGSNLGAFEVKDYKFHDPVKTKDGRVINQSDYLITTFTTGEYVIPPITIQYTDPQGEKKEIKSEPLFILVKSVGASESDQEDIRGLKSPIDVPGGYLGYLLILPVLALLGAGGFLYYRRRSRGLAMPEIPEELKRPAWEVALLELDRLRETDLLARKQVKKYFIILSDIVRKYTQRRYEIPALDRTTEEIRIEIKPLRLEPRITDSLQGLLSFCDLVKFAKYVPAAEEIEKSLSDAYDYVNMTKQEEVKEEALAAG